MYLLDDPFFALVLNFSDRLDYTLGPGLRLEWRLGNCLQSYRSAVWVFEMNLFGWARYTSACMFDSS